MRIAALDDDPAHLDLVGHCMRRIGHQCEVFSTGHRLMHMLRRESFDLLIVDWQMPELGGPDIVQWVRGSLGSTMPILMLTVRSDERDVVYGLTVTVSGVSDLSGNVLANTSASQDFDTTVATPDTTAPTDVAGNMLAGTISASQTLYVVY